MKKVLLHVCCGVCFGYPIEKLKEEEFYVESLFFNPNIHPHREYIRRKKAAREIMQSKGITLIEDEYESSSWFDICGEYEGDKEGGRRCLLCYELRLKRAFQVLNEKKFDYFTTTLTISPHKKSKVIFEIARRIGGDKFLPIDFKKNDGFKKTMNIAKKQGLYRQNYCGCIYSKR